MYMVFSAALWSVAVLILCTAGTELRYALVAMCMLLFLCSCACVFIG